MVLGEAMMGPTRIPLVHNRAFGHVGLFQNAPQVRPQLGNPMGPMGDGATIDYQKAKDYYDGIRNNYDALVALIGDAADKMVAQAKAAYEDAQRAWTSSQPTRI